MEYRIDHLLNIFVTIGSLVILLAACTSGVFEQPQTEVETNNSYLLSGWNTWNNPSVLSHVRMPDGLNLQFKLRKKGRGPYWLGDAYVANPKYNFNEKIKPKQHAYDGSYTELELEWEGAHASVFSAKDGEDLVLLYSPLEKQEKVHILVLETGFLWNKPGLLTKIEDQIKAHSSRGDTYVRTIGEQTNMRLPINTPYFTFDSNIETAIYTGKERTLEEVKAIISREKKALDENAIKYHDLSEAYNALQSVVAWNIFYDAFNDRAISSVSRIWNEAWGAYIIFDWDTYFIASLAAIDNKELAYNNVFAITGSITDGGFIPNVAAAYEKSNDRSQPPVGSMTVKLVYDQYKEKWFLEEVYENLLTWNRWWPENRDNQGYLSWGSHPHRQGMSANTDKAGKWESGLDNSPMFDGAVFNTDKHMFELGSVGLMSLYVADCKYLAMVALELGKTEDANELLERAKQYGDKINTMWDNEMGFYRDVDLLTGEFTPHKSPTHFYPLLAKVASQAQAERMINEHLLNPAEFFGEYMIPSISRDNPAFVDNSYWRGRIWAPMNYLVYMGLRNYDLPEARQLLAEKSNALLLKEWAEKRRVFENYNAVSGVGDDVRNSDPFYAWGGLLGLIPIIEAGHLNPQPLD